MSRKNRFVLLLLCSLFVACTGKSFETEKELRAFINDEDNGYKYTKIIGGTEYSLLYKPTDLLVRQELGDAKPDEKKLQVLRNKYGQYMYFTLSMSLNGKELLSNVAGNKARFGAMVNELAFGMDQKVHVYTKQKDTLAMTDFIYPRMYGMSGSTNILLVYPKDEKFLSEDYLTLAIEDLGFNTGEIKFKIDTKAILDQPYLRFN
ncbi:hypothetical protein [Flavobacterium pallidum]|uniref:DUF4840 domain-containing protein n=1 Tax=Flavobacterium pallidum TaxID=2172098 RepID=A0A2S1SFX0_9FLAO|nr:hypothetical protein [Flavobacterium pallidum]AWI25290.1 hypothetical protein HYN49_04910 [Flavobacterium pallidum]